MIAVVLPGCASGTTIHPQPSAQGPPLVQPERVHAYARWFDTKDPLRVAGSQQEEVAASYLLARLELAGYQVNLDPVPVGNLLHSTNVIALPPSGSPKTVVVVDYDTASGTRSNGLALGTFLELARSLRAKEPDHAVEFVALGAEHVAINGGQVGERSLIELLRSESSRPPIVRIGEVRSDGAELSVAGPARGAIRSAAARVHLDVGPAGAPANDALTEAGFPETIVRGDPSAGPILLAHLARPSSVSGQP